MRQDLRNAWGFVARRPVAAALCALTLAVGVGVWTTAVSVADAVVWHPLPYRQASRLVSIRQYVNLHATRPTISLDLLRQWDGRHAVFDAIEPYAMSAAWLSGAQSADVVTAAAVAPGLFRVLGIQPELGRGFSARDSDVVVLSNGLWHSRFAADPHVLGRAISINGRSTTIVGVMPRGFTFPVRRVRLWTPLPEGSGALPVASVLARLKPGVSLGEAKAAAALAGHGRRSRLTVAPFAMILPFMRTAVTVLLAGALLVLFIGIANAGNILLGEAVRRDVEVAIRRSLGASSWRLARQLLTESLLVATCAAGGGLLLAAWLVTVVAANLPRVETILTPRAIALDWRAGGFAVAAALGGGLLAGLAPLWRARSLDVQATLARAGHTGGRAGRIRALLLVGELTLSVALLVGAGLLMNSLIRLTQINVGYDPSHVMTFGLYMPQAHFGDSASRTDFLGRVRRHAIELPGVASAAISDGVPYDNIAAGRLQTTVRGEVSGKVIVNFTDADEHFFVTIGLPLLQGRTFEPRDFGQGSGAAVISRSLAARLAPHGSPLGVHFRWDPTNPWLTVVGVAGDVRNGSFQDHLGALAVYRPLMPRQESGAAEETLLVRTAGPPDAIVPSVERAIRTIDPEVPIVNAESASQVVADTRTDSRVMTLLMSVMALVALMLALLGVYGVFSCAAQYRTREIGIRLALGATPQGVVRMMMRESTRLIAPAVLLGLTVSAGLTGMMRSLLYEVSPLDPLTLSVVALLVAAVALASTGLAVRRASRVQPVDALRAE